MKKVLVLGAAGFLGVHLERRLKEDGNFVVSVARSYPRYCKSVADEFLILDLTNPPDFHSHFHRHEFDEVYQMAGEVGGIGYIAGGEYDASILTNSLKINLHTLEAMRRTGSHAKIFFASSQCVYPPYLEVDPFASERLTDAKPKTAFAEHEASFNNYAFAQEKLYSETLYNAYSRNYGIEVRIGRLGNTYGPLCEWRGDRAKAPAALMRKVAEAEPRAYVNVWGSGAALRSFTYVDDAVEGILRLMRSGYSKPLNLASSEIVSIDDLFATICKVSGKDLFKRLERGPTGSSARGSDNTLCRKVFDWEPPTSLQRGIELTYPWIREQAEKALTAAI